MNMCPNISRIFREYETKPFIDSFETENFLAGQKERALLEDTYFLMLDY